MKCIKCRTEIIPIPINGQEDLTNTINGWYEDGVVSSISPGYGSSYDMDDLMFGICDDCITDLLSNKTIERIS